MPTIYKILLTCMLVFSMRFSQACSLDIDDNGQQDALTDGLILIRYQFGLRDNALIQDAIGNNAQRSDPTAIAAFIETQDCQQYFDLDGNAANDALTDGLMAIRYLFGLTGAALTQDALGSNASRLTADAIIQWLVNQATSGLTKLENTNPFQGEIDVAITRETILRFSRALNPNTVSTTSIGVATGQTPVSSVIKLSSDKKTVTLFYPQPLPGNSSVTITVDGGVLEDENGQAVDADADGAAGGIATLNFKTTDLTIVQGTIVCGRVMAAQLQTGMQTIDEPLVNATITVDGAETTLFATTDNNGNFCLDPAPGQRFFVHFDGRTATNTVPAGAYYPFLGKPLIPVAGQQHNIGTVYLPLVEPNTLKSVSETTDTNIEFPATVLNKFPEFEGVSLVVPAGSLFSDDGTTGGMVGIAPVSPERMPGNLPDGVEFPLVITIQTDGATNFDIPAPICFPNLPDSATGEKLSPGEKYSIISFNHDSGRWELAAPATVTADGAFICSDPGTGISAPGWHAPSPPPIPSPPPADPADPADPLGTGNAPDRRIPYAAKFQRGAETVIIRGLTESFGQYTIFPPINAVLVSVSFYDPIDKKVAVITPLANPIAGFWLPRFLLTDALSGNFIDTDNDELINIAEEVYGTDPINPDTDGDGISDGVEVHNGSNPLLFAMQIGATLNGEIASQNEVDQISFTAMAGEQLIIDLTRSNFLNFVLRDEDQNVVLFNDGFLGAGLDYFRSIILENGGSYTFSFNEFFPEDISTPPFLFSVSNATYVLKLFSLPPQEFNINIGDSIPDATLLNLGAGIIEQPGAFDVYHFNSTPGQTLFFDILFFNLTGDLVPQEIDFVVRDDIGNIVFDTAAICGGRFHTSFEICNINFRSAFIFNGNAYIAQLKKGGDYTLTIGEYLYDAVGEYSFEVTSVDDPQEFNIAIGGFVSDGLPATGAGNLEDRLAVDVYQFTASPGQTVLFDMQENSISASSNVTVAVRDSDGNVVLDTNLDQSRAVALTRGGEYTIAINEKYDGTSVLDTSNARVGTYHFQLINPHPIEQFNISIGDIISDGVPSVGAGNLETKGTEDIYFFSGTTGQKIEVVLQKSDPTAKFFDSHIFAANCLSGCFDDIPVEFIDDNMFDNIPPRVIYTLPSDDNYRIHVGNRHGSDSGTYQLQLIEQ